jgi:hypothetical protein
MGTIDDDGTHRLGPDAGDAVGGQDRRKLQQRSLPDRATRPSCRERWVQNKQQAGPLRELFSLPRGKLREKTFSFQNI